jgi:hypothetical protein
MLSPSDFIADAVLPVFETPEQSGDYPKIKVEQFLKTTDTRRAPRGPYSRDDWEFDTGTYSCEDHGHEEPVDDVEARLYARFFDAEAVAVERAVHKIRLAREVRVAAMIFNTGNITLTGAVTTEWDTLATCTPKADVKTAVDALRAARGIMPNAAVMSYKVFQNVLMSTELRTYLQYTSPHLIETEQAQLDMLAKYFGLSRVIVGRAIKDSADKGLTASLGDVWDDEYVLIARLAGTARDLKEPCLGRTFLWTGDSPQILMTEQYREEQRRSNIYRVRNNVDEALVYAGAGYLLSNITT